MKSINPVNGLIRYSFYSASGNLSIAFIVISVLGVTLLATGASTTYLIFGSLTMLFTPMFLMTGTGGGATKKWEKMKVAMPVKRKDVITSHYYSIILATIVGLPFFGVILTISFFLHEDLLDYVMSTAHIFLPFFLGAPLLTSALFYPLAYTIGENKEEALTIVCMLAVSGILGLFIWIGGTANLAPGALILLIIAASVIPFIVSYAITKSVYAKKDF